MSLIPPRLSPLVPGFRLDRYELLCPVAEGGMASVWLARLHGKHGFERLVALKMILPRYANDVAFQGMFRDEARIASRIEHDNVARILDLGEDQGILFLAMEWVDGDSLSKLVRATGKKGVSIPDAIFVRALADACAGLHAAHEVCDDEGHDLAVVHRDISPQNLIVSTRGVTKVIDFGIAKARSRVAAETESGIVKGKVQYMSPEQAIGGAIDRRADVWAIGAVLYKSLTGKTPYERDNPVATVKALTSGDPPDPLPESVHPAFRRAIARALTPSVHARCSSAAELRDLLEAALVESGQPTTTHDVAAFFTKHVPERAEARRRAVKIATAAASRRSKAADVASDVTSDRSGEAVARWPVSESVPSANPAGVAEAREAMSTRPRGRRTPSSSDVEPSVAFDITARNHRTPVHVRASRGEAADVTPHDAALDTTPSPTIHARRAKGVALAVAAATLAVAGAFAFVARTPLLRPASMASAAQPPSSPLSAIAPVQAAPVIAPPPPVVTASTSTAIEAADAGVKPAPRVVPIVVKPSPSHSAKAAAEAPPPPPSAHVEAPHPPSLDADGL